MKRLLFILLLLPSLLRAESFTYNRLILATAGSDNFTVDRGSEQRADGIINFDGRSISIDSETFPLKPMKKENCFKYKGGMFRMVYMGSRLAYVQHFRYGKIYSYRIKSTAEPVKGRNSN